MVIKIWYDSENQILLCNKLEVFPAKDCQIFLLTALQLVVGSLGMEWVRRDLI